MKKQKPDCYKCKWRKDCVGSAHSQCIHPKNEAVINESVLKMVMFLTHFKGASMILKGGVKVRGNQHGINNGWFMYPFNFDPVWLEECDGFEPISSA